MSEPIQINVTYQGGHNFDWDTRLEEIAKTVRYDSTMDFKNELRTISFRFEDDKPEDEIQPSALFMAAVRSTFPDFKVVRP